MDTIHVIKRPMLTEKSTFAMNELGRYTFVVDNRATKADIKSAVESLYRVKVTGVTTQTRKGEWRRTRAGEVKGGETKIAHVRLREGDKIDMF